MTAQMQTKLEWRIGQEQRSDLRALIGRGWLGCTVWTCEVAGMEYYGLTASDAIRNAEDSDVEASELAYQDAVAVRILEVRQADEEAE